MKRIMIYTDQREARSTRITDEQAEDIALELKQPGGFFLCVHPAFPETDPQLLVAIEHIRSIDLEPLD